MMPYSGDTPLTPAVVCRKPYAIGTDCMYSGLTNLIDPSSFTASTSACFSRMRRPDRSPPGLHARLPVADQHRSLRKGVAETIHECALKSRPVRHQQHDGHDAP